MWQAALLLLLLWTPARAADTLEQRLRPLLDSYPGKVAVAVEHLERTDACYFQADEPMPTASLIKFPIMIETYRQAAAQRIDLNASVTLREVDKVPGSGLLTAHFSAGSQFSLRDAVRLMIAFSDNTATNLVIDQIGLPSTSANMVALGCPNTQLHSKVFQRETSVAPDRSRRFGLGSTTAREMVSLFRRLAEGKLANPEATAAMLSHLYACDDRSMLVRSLPPGTRVAHKTGAVARSRCDAGLIEAPTGTIVICVLTTDNPDERWTSDNAAYQLCGDLGGAVYEFFNPPQATGNSSTASEPLGVGREGPLVATLQRTLNDRLGPAAQIDVDGDFGSQTARAVQQFQSLHQLPATGRVDVATWQALGKLMEAGPPVPDPDLVNAQQPARRPVDSLAGPPHVTCQAWGIVDANRGELLWGLEPNRRVNPASTTKIMTALLVLEWADDPARLDELVTFSERADQTAGSTADLRAGEQVRVGELLYGLLLPSGNDAAVALAEHVGQTLSARDEATGDELADPLARFVRRMNQRAHELGLNETSYENPHGLTAENHLSSVRDLARLAGTAMRLAAFRAIVNTSQHGCTVQSNQGYQRNVLWKNTNQLLQVDGYDGVKTGTTDAAGACLVASGFRGDQHLILVVMGATSSDARYVDARNLFRWAWNHLAAQSVTPAEPLAEDRSAPVLVSDRALQLHQSCLVVDGHNDLPWRLRELGIESFDQFDIAKSQPKLHTDIPRLQQGGVGAQFWSVYVPVEVGQQGKALLTTLEQIERVHAIVERYPDVFQLAGSVAEIRQARQAGKIASLIGVEGGHSIENSLSVLRQLYQRGARYMTLTHSSNLDWADSATDLPSHHGLTPFGEEVVREMNRLGMLVDLSHVSVETMQHALRISRAPVIFSHSSARAVANHPRNVPDEILRLLPENGGVVMVNFYPSFVVPAAAERSVARLELKRRLEAEGKSTDDVTQELKRWEMRNPTPVGSIYDVVDHIDHIVKVAGIEHVGIGSDYDGIDAVPAQLEDVSTYPRITQELLNRGYDDDSIRKLWGENLLRVLERAEAVKETR